MSAPDLPKYLIDEERFADWCVARGWDETAEAWAFFERWVDGDDDTYPDPDLRRDEMRDVPFFGDEDGPEDGGW